MISQDWRQLLATAREAQGLSQAALAAATGISRGTVKAIEQNRRNPSRAVLTRLLDLLKLDRGQRVAILNGAGFVDELSVLDQHPGYFFSHAEARDEVDSRTWPAALVSETMEVLWANQLLQRVWGVNLLTELNSPVERNILSVISMPRFKGRLLNRVDCIEYALGIMKGHHLGPETDPSGSSPYFQAVIDHFMEGDAAVVTELGELWAKAQPRPYRVRGFFPVRWRDQDAGDMEFEIFFNTASEPLGLAFQDWIPTDSSTWERLETIRQRPTGG